MYYNLSVSGVSDPVAFLNFVNSLTQYQFGNGIVLAFFAIVFISMKTHDSNADMGSCLLVTAFLSSLVAFLLYVLNNLVPLETVFLMVVIMFASVFLVRHSQGGT